MFESLQKWQLTTFPNSHLVLINTLRTLLRMQFCLSSKYVSGHALRLNLDGVNLKCSSKDLIVVFIILAFDLWLGLSLIVFRGKGFLLRTLLVYVFGFPWYKMPIFKIIYLYPGRLQPFHSQLAERV